ncbi:MAG: SDR family oxidoreductase [Polyangia bacterium]
MVVITGASAGVGRATVRRFARDGASIGLIARGAAGLEGARREVEEAGGKAIVLPLDVTDAAAVDAAAERVERELGPIDVWINDAMTTVFGEFKDISPEEFDRVTAVCYLGFVNGTRTALRHMRPRNRGTIVQVGSVLAYRGIPLQSAYCGAKHAIRGFTDSIRCELIHHKSKVHMTMVQMPALNTTQFEWCENKMPEHSQPVPPIYEPTVAADAIHFAAGAKRREVWVGAPALVIIPANKLLPGVGDWYLGKTGFSGQQCDRPAPQLPANLWEPQDELVDRGARGPFDKRAHRHSVGLWASIHKAPLLLGAVALAAGAGLAMRGKPRRWHGLW